MDVRAGCTRQGEELRPRSGGDAVLGLDVIPIYLLGALACLFIGVPVHEFRPSRCESLSLVSLLYHAGCTHCVCKCMRSVLSNSFVTP